jgi:hypothetical protein
VAIENTKHGRACVVNAQVHHVRILLPGGRKEAAVAGAWRVVSKVMHDPRGQRCCPSLDSTAGTLTMLGLRPCVLDSPHQKQSSPPTQVCCQGACAQWQQAAQQLALVRDVPAFRLQPTAKKSCTAQQLTTLKPSVVLETWWALMLLPECRPCVRGSALHSACTAAACQGSSSHLVAAAQQQL